MSPDQAQQVYLAQKAVEHARVRAEEEAAEALSETSMPINHRIIPFT